MSTFSVNWSGCLLQVKWHMIPRWLIIWCCTCSYLPQVDHQRRKAIWMLLGSSNMSSSRNTCYDKGDIISLIAPFFNFWYTSKDDLNPQRMSKIINQKWLDNLLWANICVRLSTTIWETASEIYLKANKYPIPHFVTIAFIIMWNE